MNAAEAHAADVDKEFAELGNAAWHARTNRAGSDLEAQAIKKVTEHAAKLLDLGCHFEDVMAHIVRHIKG